MEQEYKELIIELSALYGDIKGITGIEKTLQKKLNIKKVYILPGIY